MIRIREIISLRPEGGIPIKVSNLSEEATESLGCHLIKEGILKSKLGLINSIVRRGRSGGGDILVNNYHRIEVKGTTSGSGTVTLSDGNFEAFAWMWFDFNEYFHRRFCDKVVIPVYVITNPKDCVRPERIVEVNGEKKLTIPSVKDQAGRTGNYFYNELSPKSLRITPNYTSAFFE